MSSVVRKRTFSALDWMYGFSRVIEPIGAVVLTHLDEKRPDDYLAEDELEPLMPNTITDTDPKALKEELRKVCDKGLAIGNEKFREGNAGGTAKSKF